MLAANAKMACLCIWTGSPEPLMPEDTICAKMLNIQLNLYFRVKENKTCMIH